MTLTRSTRTKVTTPSVPLPPPLEDDNAGHGKNRKRKKNKTNTNIKENSENEETSNKSICTSESQEKAETEKADAEGKKVKTKTNPNTSKVTTNKRTELPQIENKSDNNNSVKESNSRKEEKQPSPKRKKTEHQRITERESLKKLWDAEKQFNENGSYTFKICSWNVAGLRALLNKHPDALPNLVKTHNLDILCLQETKLQEIHLDDPKLKLRGHLLNEEGYDAYYSCSTTKKGYSGTAAFVKRRHTKTETTTENTHIATVKEEKTKNNQKQQTSVTQFFTQKKKEKKSKDNKDDTAATDDRSKCCNPDSMIHLTSSSPFDTECTPSKVSFGLGAKSEHDSEGRIISLDYPLFSLTNLYVPNSGAKLERLTYRTKEWDVDLVQYMDTLSRKRKKPVIWLGDLNVAHQSLDVWNDGAKHLPKSAGTTPEERDSFQRQLDFAGKGESEGKGRYVDAFRSLHGDKKGHYTYWSQRAGNREPNKGLRLDYFICSKNMMDENERVVVRDSYMLPEQVGSDHCPVILEVEIKKL